MSELTVNRHVVLTVFSVLGLVWYFALWSIGLLGCITARKRYRLRPRSPLATTVQTVPGVSILRPLKGLDTNLYENLESTFNQDYPNYEIIFSVADENDQALSVVRDLITKYPNVNAEVIIGDEPVGVNPKVNNLIRPFRKAANDILWVLDSNVISEPGTLARSVDALINSVPSGSPPRRIALVHHVPFAFINEPRLGSRIEEAFLNTNHAKMYLAINAVAIESCVVGKSNVYRRSDIERLNGTLKPSTVEQSPEDCGLHAFGRFLAEDNMIASAMWHELGLRHELSCDVARNVVGNMSLSDYIWRRVRWIRVRKHMVLAATVLEPFTEAVVLSLIAGFSFSHLFAIPPWLSMMLHFILLLVIDLDVYASLANHPLPREAAVQFIAAWAARELLTIPIFCLAVFGNEVIWRGEHYQISRNGEAKLSTNTGGFFDWIRNFRYRKRQSNYERLSTGQSE